MTAQNVTLPVSGPSGTTSPVVEGQTGVGGAIRQVVAAAPFPVSPRALPADAIVTGGTAIVVAQGPINGGWVTNPFNAAAQGISAAENAYISIVAPPGSADDVANGTAELLLPGQSFTLPALAAGATAWVNAPTAGHKFSGSLL